MKVEQFLGDCIRNLETLRTQWVKELRTGVVKDGKKIKLSTTEAQKKNSHIEEIEFGLPRLRSYKNNVTKLEEINKDIKNKEENLKALDISKSSKESSKSKTATIELQKKALEKEIANLKKEQERRTKENPKLFMDAFKFLSEHQVPDFKVPGIEKIEKLQGDKIVLSEKTGEVPLTAGRLKISDNLEKDLERLAIIGKLTEEGIKIRRYYERDGITVRKPKDDHKKDPNSLSLEDQLSTLLKLKYSVIIDDNQTPHALYEGKDKDKKDKKLGEGKDATAKFSQNLLNGEFNVARIPKIVEKGFEEPKPSEEAQKISKEMGLTKGRFVRKETTGAGVQRSRQYELQKFAGKENLADYLNRKKPKIEERFDLAIKLFEKVNEMHQKDFIHRDIKPENIVRDNHGVLTIIDHNTGKILPKDKDNKAVIVNTEKVGTLNYDAPEINLNRYGTPAEYSKATDIYACGKSLLVLMGHQADEKNFYQFDSATHEEILSDLDPDIEKLQRKYLKEISAYSVDHLLVNEIYRTHRKSASDAIKKLTDLKQEYKTELNKLLAAKANVNPKVPLPPLNLNSPSLPSATKPAKPDTIKDNEERKDNQPRNNLR